MCDLLIHDARVLTLSGATTPCRGVDLGRLGEIDRGWVHVREGIVAAVGAGVAPATHAAESIDARGRVLMPAFVDCHTHACWTGQRFDEFEMALRGATYLEILEAGGGIMSTVGAVRTATTEHLTRELTARLRRMMRLGTTTVEVKSGYGLSTEAELKMLHAIELAAAESPLTIVPTFLGAHAIDRDNPRFVDETIEETLPAVAARWPGITCDAYCENGAWSVGDTVRLFERARALGCPIRVHADQFNSLGMVEAAIALEARSVDHLEATTPADIARLAASETFGVALPCSGFHLDDRYAPARDFVDAGGALAIATNYNPGSAPTPSIPFTIALACRKLRLTPAEAISAATVNAAALLGLHDRGTIEQGRRADLQLLDATDERDLGYEFATAGPDLVVSGGRVVVDRTR